MEDTKLTITQLKNYLGTGLKVLRPDGRTVLTLSGIEESNTLCFDDNEGWKYGDVSKNRPICYRLSDLDKFIPELGFVPADQFSILFGGGAPPHARKVWKEIFVDSIIYSPIGTIDFEIVQLLFQWHFWPFGEEYFEQGLIIDKLKQ